MLRTVIVFLLVLNTALGTDYVGRLAADDLKGGDPSLGSQEAPVSPNGTPGDVSAPDDTLAGEASEDRSPSPDDPAPQPFDPATVVHEITAIGGTGSCTYLGDGLFISCAHIFEDAQGNPLGAGPIKIDGKQYGGTRHALHDVDLSFIQLNHIPEDWVAVKGLIAELKDGVEVQVHGIMSGTHKGTVDLSQTFNSREVWATLPENTNVIPGDSGGGVFDPEGNLIGVIVGDHVQGDHVFFRPLYLEAGRFPKHPNLFHNTAPQPPKETMAAITGIGIEYLLFSAPWCGPCGEVKKTILPKIEAAGYTVIPINIDIKHDMSVQYDILSIPTWVILKDGKEIGRESYGNVDTLLQKAK